MRGSGSRQKSRCPRGKLHNSHNYYNYNSNRQLQLHLLIHQKRVQQHRKERLSSSAQRYSATYKVFLSLVTGMCLLSIERKETFPKFSTLLLSTGKRTLLLIRYPEIIGYTDFIDYTLSELNGINRTHAPHGDHSQRFLWLVSYSLCSQNL
jgi:hypothetical protein